MSMTNVMNRTSSAAAEVDPYVVDPFSDDPFISRPTIRSTLTLARKSVLRRRKPKLAYAAVVIVGVFAIVVTQLMLSIGLSNGAYEIESLQAQQTTVDRTNESLTEKLDGLSSPQNLAASAQSLGMVANVNPVYLRLSDGAVLGTPKKASATAGPLSGGTSSLTPNAAIGGLLGAGTPAPATATTIPAAGTPAAGTAAAGTPAPAAGAAATPAAAAPASAPPAAAPTAPVPFSGELPSPTTH